MKTNSIGGISDQQVPLDIADTAGSPKESRDKTIPGGQVTPKMNLLSSVIAQSKIAKDFIKMDGADDPDPQRSPDSNGQNKDVAHLEPKDLSCSGDLRSIVHDDIKWNFFIQSVCLKAPHSEAARSMRTGLINAFESGDWNQVKNDPLFLELTQKELPASKIADKPDGTDKRIDLWLEASDFLKQLFTAVQDGDLLSHPNLVTDSRLIDFVLALPEDAE